MNSTVGECNINLNAYFTRWNQENQYIIWGADRLGEQFLEKFEHDLHIAAFADSNLDKRGNAFHGYMVLSPEECLARDLPIIVASRFYHEIKMRLQLEGLQEDVQFTYEQKFEEIFRWFTKKRIICREYDLSITPRCTLRCVDCNMQMPRYRDQSHFPLEEIKKEVDAYFHWVDHVQFLGVLGGEPFLHPQLDDILEYIACKYRDRITYLEVLTNGTVLPDQRFWDLSERYRISIQLSDYSDSVPAIKERIAQTREQIRAHHLLLNDFRYDAWQDFGLKCDLGEPEDILNKKFYNCNHMWRSVYQGRYYFCHLELSAIRAGLYQASEEDTFPLTPYDPARREAFLAYDLKMANPFLSYCRLCHGCFSENEREVPPARQLMKKVD